jgi:hypothetical protein
MNVVRELGKLKSTLRNLSVLVLLTVILHIGIIVFLLSIVKVRIPKTDSSESTSTLLGASAPVKMFWDKIHRDFSLKLNENTLLYIFQIRGPIGVFLVSPSAVPGSETSFFVSSLGSFDADQCVSSEGFLVAFTPSTIMRAGEVIFSYSLFSECSIFHNRFQTTVPKGARNLDGRRDPGFCDLYRSQSTRKCRNRVCRSIPSVVAPAIEGRIRCGDTAPGEEMRSNVMTPGNLTVVGILAALKPTDEDRIGTGRNTLGSYYERC